MEFPFEVAYEDNHLLIVSKNAGILVQSDETGDKCLADFAKEFLKQKYNKEGNVFCGVVHRLDRPVSGLVVLAKTSKALSRMNELFRDDKIEKFYLARVLQKPKNESDTLINWLRKDTRKHYASVYTKEVENSQYAELSFDTQKLYKKGALLEVKLKTGRFHQIRAQLAKIGFTIKGDLKYGAPVPNKDASICLHAYKIRFIHPVSNENMEIVNFPPKNFFWDAE